MELEYVAAIASVKVRATKKHNITRKKTELMRYHQKSITDTQNQTQKKQK